ncbi:fibrillarin-like rRNA/tRNA 2'-O-methyltransferase [Halococcus salsus]|uniref:fibrillarin-like rRNA/tRNA 2'-O-methyltransferase n=1 Tax=Halococcus salsus TaxID=2162894 RepID=UPI00135893E7|nr:fibrillarin-like rRNA/tRNA 2'-O-methyltransferase [Halococcus salsus]
MDLPEGIEYREFDGEERLATRGEPVYGEPTAEGWRAWDARRSKLGAMYERGMEPGLQNGDRVLYLGAANGTTASHVADVARVVYAVEFAARPMRDLVDVAGTRDALVPLLKDARKPASYGHVVEADLDVLVQDVATRGQARVACANRRFLADDGRLAAVVKARSEDTVRDPEAVFEDALDHLRNEYRVLETKRLDPFHADHLAVVAEPR